MTALASTADAPRPILIAAGRDETPLRFRLFAAVYATLAAAGLAFLALVLALAI